MGDRLYKRKAGASVLTAFKKRRAVFDPEVMAYAKRPADRDVIYFLAQSFRDRLLLELPEDKEKLDAKTKNLAFRAKAMMKDLSLINFELAQMIVSDDDGKTLPDWFMVEMVRDLPRLVQK